MYRHQKKKCLVTLTIMGWRNQNDPLLEITPRSRGEDGDNNVFRTNVPKSKQIKQLDGTDILDGFVRLLGHSIPKTKKKITDYNCFTKCQYKKKYGILQMIPGVRNTARNPGFPRFSGTKGTSVLICVHKFISILVIKPIYSRLTST